MIPRKLAKVVKQHNGHFHPIAKALNVNVFHVHALLNHGKEPTNPQIRERMYLPMKRLPQRNQPKTPETRQERDFFQTPAYAVDLIGPYVQNKRIWEPAAGHGRIANRLRDQWHCSVIETDVLQGVNFLENLEPHPIDYIVTNPPFSLKREFFTHCLYLGLPFALLIPTADCQWTLKALRDDGCQWLKPTARIDYITPSGKAGQESAAQFHSGWLTKGLHLPEQTTIMELTKEQKRNI
jgi:hypothetical protein